MLSNGTYFTIIPSKADKFNIDLRSGRKNLFKKNLVGARYWLFNAQTKLYFFST